jgi:uncharacterized membrane protein
MDVLRLASTVTAIACGVSGSVLFGFSTIVMPALRAQRPAVAAAAMQSINLAAPRSLFMVPLVGSALGALAVGVLAASGSEVPGRPWLLAGAGTGLLTMAITAGYHVPRNNAFSSIDPSSPGIAAAWAAYEPGWTAWNHLRAAAGLVAAGLLFLGRR